MVKIAFWDNCLCERGTTVSLYDYAYHNKTILGNESIILYNITRKENVDIVIERFKKEFLVIGVSNFNLVDPILINQNCDIFYIIKAGCNEGQFSKVKKTVVHCVFHCRNPHGAVYASISPYIKNYNNGVPVVPHMINLPETSKDMRDLLNIPKNAIVYGRYGGYNEFDIPYVHRIVHYVAKNNSNIYFLFANTKRFCEELNNIIHIDMIIDLTKKVEFINTCDAMLWGRHDGESFGLSIGEFSSKNKPVLAAIHFQLNPNTDVAHVNFLREKGIWYNQTNLYNILTNFITEENREAIANQDWNAFKEFTPEKVMNIFEDVFIK